ncbi:MAG: glycine zipper 2TM domain-containing protein, partial [Caldimonas sp.]
RRCSNAGTIIGGVAGALLGGEIGRGNYRYSRRSGTGTVLGAGLGALVGSGIDRDNCDRAHGYRR